ncbi:unnamed protein product, partial [Ectocarpus sp. 12 AP-2014]
AVPVPACSWHRCNWLRFRLRRWATIPHHQHKIRPPETPRHTGEQNNCIFSNNVRNSRLSVCMLSWAPRLPLAACAKRRTERFDSSAARSNTRHRLLHANCLGML